MGCAGPMGRSKGKASRIRRVLQENGAANALFLTESNWTEEGVNPKGTRLVGKKELAAQKAEL